MEAVKRIEDFRLFEAHEIQVRAGQKTSKGDKIALLLYQDARAAMRRLDERFGEYGWQREHKDVHGVTYCGVSLWDEDKKCWVTKWDAGEPSKTSPQKGEASDSFKRACVNWGIGRELYTAPRMYVPIDTDTYGLSVASIAYDEHRKITALTIKDMKGNIIYQYGAKNAGERQKTAQATAQQIAPTSTKEQEEFTELLSDIDAAESLEQLSITMEKAKSSPYYQALRNAANNKAKQNGWKKEGA